MALDGKVHWLPWTGSTHGMLCLHLPPDSPLLHFATNVLDDVLAHEPGASRMHENRDDVTDPVIHMLRQAAVGCSERWATKITIGSVSAVAVETGVPKKVRIRMLHVALSLAYIIKFADEGRTFLKTYLNGIQMEKLAREAWNARQRPLRAVELGEGPGPGATLPSCPESLKRMATALGASEECCQDPFMSIDLAVGHVVCVACRRELKPEHLTAASHRRCLADVPRTLAWLKGEGRGHCLGALVGEERGGNPFGEPEEPGERASSSRGYAGTGGLMLRLRGPGSEIQ
jgi:hypothetical protein